MKKKVAKGTNSELFFETLVVITTAEKRRDLFYTTQLKVNNIYYYGTRSKSTERTLKMEYDGHGRMFGLYSIEQWIYFTIMCRLRITLSTTIMESQTLDEAM